MEFTQCLTMIPSRNDNILVMVVTSRFSTLVFQVCTKSSQLTHSHISGVNNALLQAMAIKQALKTEEGQLNPVEFVDKLLEKIKPLEEGKFDEDDSDSQM